MILINLLPYREEKRKRRKTAFFVGLGVSAVLGAVVVGAGMLLLQQMTAAQASRNHFFDDRDRQARQPDQGYCQPQG